MDSSLLLQEFLADRTLRKCTETSFHIHSAGCMGYHRATLRSGALEK
jgi:hypothetical protein